MVCNSEKIWCEFPERLLAYHEILLPFPPLLQTAAASNTYIQTKTKIGHLIVVMLGHMLTWKG